jgi:hypothetical protein
MGDSCRQMEAQHGHNLYEWEADEGDGLGSILGRRGEVPSLHIRARLRVQEAWVYCGLLPPSA